jgi:hypothetical protein
MSEKLPVIKELSRAIANITEHINKISSAVGTLQAPPQEKASELRSIAFGTPADRKKEEIKQIKNEKMEMQPKAISEKAETAKWKMEDIIKVIKLDLSVIDYRRSEDDPYVRLDLFENQAIP